MEFKNAELTGESTEIVANLRIAHMELEFTLLEFHKAMKRLKSIWIMEHGDVRNQNRKYITKARDQSQGTLR